MDSVHRHSFSSSRLPALAVGGWLMALPATVLLAAAILRQLQPRQHEPARTSWMIVGWAAGHISRFGAAVLFVGLPVTVVIMGGVTLLRIWREDQTLRQDAMAALAILRRHLIIGALAAATLLAGAILTVVLAHVITD